MNVATALGGMKRTFSHQRSRQADPRQAAQIEGAINHLGRYEMTKLVYGKNDQVQFLDEAEKTEAFDYLINSQDVEFVHEPNQDSGAWASEKRIYFYSETGVPVGLVRNWTAGRGNNVVGRINCADLYDEVLPLRDAKGS